MESFRLKKFIFWGTLIILVCHVFGNGLKRITGNILLVKKAIKINHYSPESNFHRYLIKTPTGDSLWIEHKFQYPDTLPSVIVGDSCEFECYILEYPAYLDTVKTISDSEKVHNIAEDGHRYFLTCNQKYDILKTRD